MDFQGLFRLPQWAAISNVAPSHEAGPATAMTATAEYTAILKTTEENPDIFIKYDYRWTKNWKTG